MNDGIRFWLIRHAPVDGPVGIIHGPEAPARLTDTQTLSTLRTLLPSDAAILASPARRTRETAEAIRPGPVAVEPLLREQDFGAWTGRRHDDIAAATKDGDYRAFWQRASHNRPPGGESFVDQIERCRAALDKGRDRPNTVWVVHSGTVRAMLAIALNLGPEAALSFVIDPLSLTIVDRIGDGWRVGRVNWLPRPLLHV